MGLHDYDVVRKYFDCWKPSGLHPATVPLCLQVLAVFLFLSGLLFSHSRCIHSLKHQECLEHSYYFKSPTIAHSEQTGCRSKGNFFVHICNEVSCLEIDIITHCSPLSDQ